MDRSMTEATAMTDANEDAAGNGVTKKKGWDRGRPPSFKSGAMKQLQVRVPQPTYRAILAQADREGTSRADVIRSTLIQRFGCK